MPKPIPPRRPAFGAKFYPTDVEVAAINAARRPRESLSAFVAEACRRECERRREVAS